MFNCEYYTILFNLQAIEFLYSGKILNAIDAQKIGLVNEIIDDGDSGKNQLIKKLRTEIAKYKLVKNYTLFRFLAVFETFTKNGTCSLFMFEFLDQKYENLLHSRSFFIIKHSFTFYLKMFI